MTKNTLQKWGFARGEIHRILLVVIPLFFCVYVSVNLLHEGRQECSAEVYRRALCLPLGLRSMPSTWKGPFLRAISCSMMPKLYTSPFWVPWGGWRSYISSSGAVQSFSEENTMDELIKGHECKRMLSSMKMHTCVKRVRVVIFAGRPEACQTIICNLQNEPTIHDAIGWLKVPVAADVAVVKIVHSLVERKPINRVALTCKYMLLEKRLHSRTAQSR